MTAFRAALRPVLPVLLALQVVGFFGSVQAAYAQEPVATVSLREAFTQEDFLAYTNAARLRDGEEPLVANPRLEAAAEAKAADMVAKGYWDHFRPGDGKAPWDFIKEAGYDYRVAGENLARGFRTPAGITKAWLASPAHRANLLSPRYTDVGFASVYERQDDGSVVLITVQMFGSR